MILSSERADVDVAVIKILRDSNAAACLRRYGDRKCGVVDGGKPSLFDAAPTLFPENLGFVRMIYDVGEEKGPMPWATIVGPSSKPPFSTTEPCKEAGAIAAVDVDDDVEFRSTEFADASEVLPRFRSFWKTRVAPNTV